MLVSDHPIGKQISESLGITQVKELGVQGVYLGNDALEVLNRKPGGILYLGRRKPTLFSDFIWVGAPESGGGNYTLFDFLDHGYNEVCTGIMGRTRRFQHLQIIIDTSILDSSVLSWCKPGGLSNLELHYILNRLQFLKHWESSGVQGFGEQINKQALKVLAEMCNVLLRRKKL